MTDWSIAAALETLRAEVNAEPTDRSKDRDRGIGRD
jgi:hypothetical protein